MMLFASIADDSVRHQEVMIDDSLLTGVAEGDKDAFSTLYQLAGQSVYAYALSMLKNPAEAEDILQDTFLKIRSAASLYTPQGKPMAWILTITRNLCLMKFRQQKHLSFLPVEDLRETPDLTKITDLEDRLVLQCALRILSDEECQIIILHAVTGWKHREIAELMGMPVATVLSKYHRGIRKLRTELEGKL